MNAARQANRGDSPWRTVVWPAFRAAFPHTLPILAAFLFLGLTYGILMNVSGFSFWYPMLMSLTILAGSVEFLGIGMLLAPFNPLQALLITLMVNGRHIFYGISMLDRYKGMGAKKPYLVFGLCDETFSINYTASIPPGVDRGWFMLAVTLLNHLYWFAGATLGGIFGTLVQVDLTGLEFVLTAMFTVILMEQWMKDRSRAGEWLGLGLTAGSLALFGAESFMIPAMLAIVLALTCLRPVLDDRGGTNDDEGNGQGAGEEA